MIFGSSVAEGICYQMVVYFLSSRDYSLCTTWQNTVTRKSHFSNAVRMVCYSWTSRCLIYLQYCWLATNSLFTVRYGTIRNAILTSSSSSSSDNGADSIPSNIAPRITHQFITCSLKLTQVSLIYRTEPKTKKGKQKTTKELKTDMLKSVGKRSRKSVEYVVKKERKATVGRICRKGKVQAWNRRARGWFYTNNNKYKC